MMAQVTNCDDRVEGSRFTACSQYLRKGCQEVGRTRSPQNKCDELTVGELVLNTLLYGEL